MTHPEMAVICLHVSLACISFLLAASRISDVCFAKGANQLALVSSLTVLDFFQSRREIFSFVQASKMAVAPQNAASTTTRTVQPAVSASPPDRMGPTIWPQAHDIL